MNRVELVLEAERNRAAILREEGFVDAAAQRERFAQRIEASLTAGGYMIWLPEDQAIQHTGKSQRWLRSRYRGWAAEGNAYKEKGIRYYRQVALPRRSAKGEEAYQAGLNAIKGS